MLYAGVAAVAIAALGASGANAQALGGGETGSKPLTIGVREVTTFDSNPARGSGSAATIRDVQPDEFIVSPSVTIDYSRRVGRQAFSLSGSFGYDYHTKNDNLSRENLQFASEVSKGVGSLCAVNGAATYSRGQSPLQYQDITVTKNTLQIYRITVGESCATPTGFTQNLQVSYGSASNSSSELDDYSTLGASGSLGYANDVVGNVALVLSYNRTNYDDNPGSALLKTQALDVYGIGVQITRPIGARLQGSAALFYSHSTQDRGASGFTADSDSFDGVTASAGLTYIVGPRLRLSADVARDVSATIRQDAAYAVTTHADLTADYTVSSRITASLGGRWSRDSYRGRDVLVSQTAPNRMDVSSVFGSVSVRVGRGSAVAFDVRHEEGRADLDLFDYTSNRASLTLATSF